MAVRKLKLAQWLVNTAYCIGYKLVRMSLWFNDRRLPKVALGITHIIHWVTTAACVGAARLRVAK